jgi:hypothetical protein
MEVFMGLFSVLFGGRKEAQAMAEVARQVLMIVASGEREGSITVETLKFPGSGSPGFVVKRVSDYLSSGGVMIQDVNRVPDTYLVTFRVTITDGYDNEPFGADYQAQISD